MPDSDLTLGFDTSAAHCAAALLSGDRVLAETVEPMTKGQAERLFPLLQDLLKGADADWKDLSRIGVGIGPGNFTGVRISVAAARGLALSLGIPAIGVSGPDAMALDLPRPLRVIIPAARGEMICQEFPADPGQPEGQIRLIRELPDDGLPSTGPGAPAGLAPAHPLAPAYPLAPVYPLAVAIARIARARALTGDAVTRPAPIYLRPADAAPPRDPAPRIIP
ncbi:tRNA (adenosine(37)-N6)-threonylcarbamoyltransferase complex dimerization subunit type 1 TsaB [Paracoccus pacificus]|uniref:tRNA (Adenosine(37)-N6)-threonylcarbamoyltransferase complex dimerization subunit type 1 TsaB n=1 Tax=Paracoccus pacificus TaxID=1463598 RepID=A0ABW4R7W0_9RHOB